MNSVTKHGFISHKACEDWANTNLCQQLSIREVHCGSTSLGISRRWFMKPTAPITCQVAKQITHNSLWLTVFQVYNFVQTNVTCIELRLSQGILCVTSSHSITPKLYTSDLDYPKQEKNGFRIEIFTWNKIYLIFSWPYFSSEGSLRRTSGAIHWGCICINARMIIHTVIAFWNKKKKQLSGVSYVPCLSLLSLLSNTFHV